MFWRVSKLLTNNQLMSTFPVKLRCNFCNLSDNANIDQNQNVESTFIFFFSFADNSCNLYITFQQKVALYINHWFAIACRQLVRLQTYVSCNVLCKGKIEYRKGCPDMFTWKGSMALSPCGSYLYDYLLTLKRSKCLA